MAKLWLTERAYTLWGSLIRITYWVAAIYLSSIYVQYYSQHNYFKIGLILMSLSFVVGFILFTRIIDHFFKTTKI